LEGIIRENVGAFYEVGMALMKILDLGYYRDVLGFETIEECCKKWWDFSRTRSHQLIKSVEVRDNVLTVVNIYPTSEMRISPLPFHLRSAAHSR
jgi:hypothetical protein